jgi:hypothetical protein
LRLDLSLDEFIARRIYRATYHASTEPTNHVRQLARTWWRSAKARVGNSIEVKNFGVSGAGPIALMQRRYPALTLPGGFMHRPNSRNLRRYFPLFFRQPSGSILRVPAQAGYGDKRPL